MFYSSAYKTDVNVPADIKYLKTPVSNPDGRQNFNWSERLGFKESSMKGISPEAPLPAQWDRYGFLGGANFAGIPIDSKVYTYSQRAIPYVENPNAYHHGTFDNTHYFDIIDCIADGNRDELSIIVGKSISEDDFWGLQTAYQKYINDAEKAVKGLGMNEADYRYGLQGVANQMFDMEGGATQFVTPISGDALQKLNVLKEIVD